ncbi:MAG TPA: hypothetical protein VN624_04330 [Rhodanobacter sp.]|nr:hypothetical protein [Rhodanobacter sp.]
MIAWNGNARPVGGRRSDIRFDLSKQLMNVLAAWRARRVKLGTMP